MDFTKLEAAALEMFIAEYATELPGLSEALRAARPIARTNSGSGFFTDLTVDRLGVPKIDVSGPLDGVGVRLAGMKTRLELMIFFKGGYANLLEGYSVEGDSTKDIDLDGEYSELAPMWPPPKV